MCDDGIQKAFVFYRETTREKAEERHPICTREDFVKVQNRLTL